MKNSKPPRLNGAKPDDGKCRSRSVSLPKGLSDRITKAHGPHKAFSHWMAEAAEMRLERGE